MDIQATCGCGAKVTVAPGSPSSLGNGHGYAANNTATVDAERAAVEGAFAKWVAAHQQCNQPSGGATPGEWYVTYRGNGSDLATDVLTLMGPTQRDQFREKWAELTAGLNEPLDTPSGVARHQQGETK